MPNKETYIRLHRALREFPRYNQFLDKAHGIELLPVESHILVEVDANEDITIQELSRILIIEKTAISKLIKSLISKKWMVFKASKSDLRQKPLQLTKLGKTVLKKFDALANERLANFDCIARLSSQERKGLVKLLTCLADCLAAPESLARDNEHFLRSSIRRLTRSFDLLGRRALGSELNTLEWQILLTVCENVEALTIGTLTEILSVSKPKTAIAIKKLESLSYIKRVKHLNDGRIFYINPTKQAFKFIDRLEQEAAHKYSTYKHLTDSDLAIVERWIRSAAVFYHIFQHNFVIAELKSWQLDETRKLCLNKYLSSIPTIMPPTVCFSEENFCMNLTKDNVLFAACEFDNSKMLWNIYFEDGFTTEAMRAFISYSLDRSMKSAIKVQKHLMNILVCEKQINTTLRSLFS